MNMPSFLTAAALMGGGGGPEPDTLPSLDVPNIAPQPLPMPGSMPDPRPMRDAPGTGRMGGLDFVREIAPLIMSAVVGAKNPRRAAAIARGFAAGGMHAQRERLQAQQREDEIRQLGVQFMRQTAADVMRLKDPIERQRYLEFAHDIGVQQFNLPAKWTQKVPAHNETEDLFASMKGELSAQLEAFDKNPKWKDVANTPQEAKISFRLKNGQTVPVNKARQLIGQAVYDDTGAQAFAPVAQEPEAKTETERAARLLAGIRAAKARGDNAKAAELQASYDDLMRATTDARAQPAPPASIEAAIMAAYRSGNQAEVGRLLALKAQSSEAGRKPDAAPDGGQNAALVASILENPTIYDGLTPTMKTALAGDLAKAGFGFGKNLSETAIGRISETKSAIEGLRDLRKTLQENEQYIGPVAGLAAINPYSGARAAQAKIDLVRQRVGKALEGGVLRKEDEEKYKKILATLRDTPEMAITKVDQLITSLERDLSTYEEEQRRAGRRVPSDKPKPDTALPPKPPAHPTAKWSKSLQAWVIVTGKTADGQAIVRRVK